MLVCLTHNKIVDLLHVCFIHTLLSQSLTNSLVNILLFEVVHFFVCLGTLNARVRDYLWNLWFRKVFWCLGNDGWLTDISVGFPKVLRCPGKLV